MDPFISLLSIVIFIGILFVFAQFVSKRENEKLELRNKPRKKSSINKNVLSEKEVIKDISNKFDLYLNERKKAFYSIASDHDKKIGEFLSECSKVAKPCSTCGLTTMIIDSFNETIKVSCTSCNKIIIIDTYSVDAIFDNLSVEKNSFYKDWIEVHQQIGQYAELVLIKTISRKASIIGINIEEEYGVKLTSLEVLEIADRNYFDSSLNDDTKLKLKDWFDFINFEVSINDDENSSIKIDYRFRPINANKSEQTERSRRIKQSTKDKVWRRDEGKCVSCGSNINIEFDHIIPFSKGGSNSYRNIQLLCQDCNRAKSANIG